MIHKDLYNSYLHVGGYPFAITQHVMEHCDGATVSITIFLHGKWINIWAVYNSYKHTCRVTMKWEQVSFAPHLGNPVATVDKCEFFFKLNEGGVR